MELEPSPFTLNYTFRTRFPSLYRMGGLQEPFVRSLRVMTKQKYFNLLDQGNSRVADFLIDDEHNQRIIYDENKGNYILFK